jgi:predicted DNA binding protein
MTRGGLKVAATYVRPILEALQGAVVRTVSRMGSYGGSHFEGCVTGVLVEFTVGTKGCPLVKLTEKFPEISVEYVDMATLPEGSFMEEFLIRGPRADEFERALQGSQALNQFRKVERLKDGSLCQGVLKGNCIRSFLASRGWIPTAAVAVNGREAITMHVDDRKQLKTLMDEVKQRYPDFELTRLVPGDVGHRNSEEFLESVGLTAKQREALRAAHLMGYFDSPRGKSASDIAAELNIDRSTFSRHLRIAMRKITAALLR